MIFKLATLLVVCPLTVFASQIPALKIPDGVGVNIHFVEGHEKDLDLIVAAGFKWIRMDFSWEWTEEKKGVYNFSSFDTLTKNLEKRGLSAIYILDYSNGLYEKEVESENPLWHNVER